MHLLVSPPPAALVAVSNAAGDAIHRGHYLWALAAGVAGLGLFIVLVAFVRWTTPQTRRGRHRWLVLIEGADGRLSTSKFQWFAWTGVIAGSYCAVYMARILVGQADPVPDIPSNVLIALGFSAASMATAKGVTTAYMAGGRVTKEPPPTAANSKNVAMAGGLLTDDVGIADLSKIQLMTFTVIALAVYAYTVTNQIGNIELNHVGLAIPDIDGSLMVLTGLSQGGYIGKKLTATSNQPALSSLVPGIAKPSDKVTLYGANFGQLRGDDDYLTITAVNAEHSSWTDSKIEFLVPLTNPAGGAWPQKTDVAVGVIIAGQPSSSTLNLTVIPA